MQTEGHPIPQDITGFQFRIIGDMTIKQFVFLALSLVVGWILFSLPFPLLLKGPVAGVIVVCGIFFAFAPVGGRSADTMILLFFKALFKPNQFSYQKQQNQVVTTTPILPSPIPPTSDEEQAQHAVLLEQTATVLPTPPQQPELPKEETPPVQVEEIKEIQHELSEAKTEEEKDQGTSDQQQAHQKVLELEKQMQELLAQKDALEKHVVSLQQQLTSKPEEVFKPTDTQAITPNVKTVPAPLKKEVGVPFVPDVPNLIIGIIKDPRGNVLPNILIEVTDKNENPVRAFKTNQLGQFASATPVSNGTYTVHFEDPKKEQKFDTISITADGKILQPLEVMSVDAREELRKSLFQTA